MIVALRADDLRAQEDLHRRRQMIQRHPLIAHVEAHGPAVPGRAIGRQ